MSRPVHCLTCCVPALEPTGCWVGPGLSWLKNGGHQEGSHQWVLPRNSTAGVFIPAVSRIHPTCHTFTGHLQYQQVGLAQDLMRSLLFPVFLVCPRPCVHPPRAEFLFALVCGFPVSRLCWPSKPGALGLLPRPALHIGEPHVRLRTFTPVGELL